MHYVDQTSRSRYLPDPVELLATKPWFTTW